MGARFAGLLLLAGCSRGVTWEPPDAGFSARFPEQPSVTVDRSALRVSTNASVRRSVDEFLEVTHSFSAQPLPSPEALPRLLEAACEAGGARVVGRHPGRGCGRDVLRCDLQYDSWHASNYLLMGPGGLVIVRVTAPGARALSEEARRFLAGFEVAGCHPLAAP